MMPNVGDRTSDTMPQDGDRHSATALIARLEAGSSDRRQTLDAEIEARRRAEPVVAAPLDHVPALPETIDAQGRPQDVHSGPLRDETIERALRP
jgi:hypothetical protein